MFDFEIRVKTDGYEFIIGVDEAGRGPLAGPVVAAAVCLRQYEFQSPINDSKKLTPLKREIAFLEIYEKAYVGVGIISESVIDRVNILNATFLAMNRAVEDCISRIEQEVAAPRRMIMLIDGNRFSSQLAVPYQTIVDGDAKVASIMCASIIAKVTRDRILDSYDQVFPQYGFRQHKGYGTEQHRKAIREFGPSLIHRRSFTL